MYDINREALMIALDIAIKAQAQKEKSQGFTMDSAMLRTWKDTLAKLEKGQQINIKD